jgi:hypothetical protein
MRYALPYSSDPVGVNSLEFSCKSDSIVSISEILCSAAYLRTSSVIFIHQKCGTHIEQKCAVFGAFLRQSFIMEFARNFRGKS